jgi:hypothetical protein
MLARFPSGARGGKFRRMSQPNTTPSSHISALELRRHVIQLEAERALAIGEGLGAVEAYMADLDEELEHRRHLYVAAAVTEIATLRAELFGPQLG